MKPPFKPRSTTFDEPSLIRRAWLAIGSGLLVAGWLGCGREPALRVEAPDRLTLYSIDGRQDSHDPKPGPDEGSTFYGYPLLGKVAIDDPRRREALVAAFNRGIARSDGTMAKCFWPRHALRLVKDGKTTDFLICFECMQFESLASDHQTVIAIDRSPQPVFNDELKRAGIPLAPSAIKEGE